MSTRLHPGPGQGELFTLALDPHNQRAFSWAANHILAHEPLRDISDENLDRVAVNHLRPELFPGSTYGRVIGGIAVNAYEYNLIPRSARAISAKVAATTGAARLWDDNRDRTLAAEERSVGHALLGYADRDGLMQWLATERTELHQLQEAMSNPGLRRFSETNWNIILTNTRQLYFPNILNVVGHRKRWELKSTKLPVRL